MVRQIDPSRGRLPMAGTGKSARPDRVTPAGERLRPRAARRSWMQELLFEAGLTRGEDPDGPASRPLEDPAFASGPSRDMLMALTAEPGRVIASVAEYRTLLHARFDPAVQMTIEHLSNEPVLAAAGKVWRTGSGAGNRRVAESLVRYLGEALGDAYGFEPVPVLFDDQRAAGFRGLYDRRFDRVYLPSRLAAGTLHDFIDVVTHEQMHAFQDRLMGRLQLLKGEPLSGLDRMLATYWKNEEGKYRALMASGSDMSPETREKYRNIGQEYHAITTGLAIAGALDSRRA